MAKGDGGRCPHSAFAFRLSPFALRLSPFALRLSPFAFRLLIYGSIASKLMTRGVGMSRRAAPSVPEGISISS